MFKIIRQKRVMEPETIQKNGASLKTFAAANVLSSCVFAKVWEKYI